MAGLWYRALLGAATRIYYRRVVVVGDRPARDRRPVLYLGLHRNGAVDGMVYLRAAPRATFLVAGQLLRSPVARIFFTGIPVERAKDGSDRSGNATALARCVLHLAAGRDLFILPEGTSDLGPRHLPFHAGAGLVLSRALAAGVPVVVQPIGIFYDAPESFRSDVTVVFGRRIATELPTELPERARVAALMRRMTAALEALAVEGSSAPELARIEDIAALACEAPGAVYHATLAAVARAVMPDGVDAAWARLARARERGRLSCDRGVPALSRRGTAWSIAWLAVQTPLVIAAALVNAPPLVAAWLAARRLADARNTIALWRLVGGTLAALVWFPLVAALGLMAGRAWLLLAYAGLTVAGLVAWPELRARWPRFRNAFRGARRRIYAADAAAVADWARGLVEQRDG